MKLFHNEDEIIANNRLKRLIIYLNTGAKFFNDIETKELADKYQYKYNKEIEKYNVYTNQTIMYEGNIGKVRDQFEFNVHTKSVFALVNVNRESKMVDIKKLIAISQHSPHIY